MTESRTLGTTRPRGRERQAPASTPQLIVVLECDRPHSLSSCHSLAGIDTVLVGRGERREAHRERTDDVALLTLRIPDGWLSSTHCRMTSALGGWVVEDAGSRNGTRVNGRVVQRHILADGDLLELGHTLLIYRVAKELDRVDIDLREARELPAGMATLSPMLAAELDKLVQLAPSAIPILVLGASGTGKEVLARAIHRLSGRTGDFVAVNCGAIPESLVESELFGHKKGAFSGAVSDQQGLIRSAESGTLFLDEIGDLPLSSQAKLLRVLQEREVRPVGSTKSEPVDVRLVSATHVDLTDRRGGGEFREDLYARISGYSVTLPPLCARREDLGLLIGTLLATQEGERSEVATIDVEAARAMFRYDWPLNIRELKNVLATAVILADGGAIGMEHLSVELRAVPSRTPRVGAAGAELTEEQQQQRDLLVEHLRAHGGNVSAVARAMGKDRKQIQRWLKKYSLRPEAYRQVADED